MTPKEYRIALEKKNRFHYQSFIYKDEERITQNEYEELVEQTKKFRKRRIYNPSLWFTSLYDDRIKYGKKTRYIKSTLMLFLCMYIPVILSLSILRDNVLFLSFSLTSMFGIPYFVYLSNKYDSKYEKEKPLYFERQRRLKEDNQFRRQEKLKRVLNDELR